MITVLFLYLSCMFEFFLNKHMRRGRGEQQWWLLALDSPGQSPEGDKAGILCISTGVPS